MGINYLRKWSRDSKQRKGNLKPTIHHSIEKRLHFHCASGTKNFRLNEYFVGSLNGFLVTQVLRAHGERRIVTAKRRIVSFSEYLVPRRQQTVDDTNAEFFSAQICRKRKFSFAGLLAGTCASMGEKLEMSAESVPPILTAPRNEFESPSKKLKTEPNLPITSVQDTSSQISPKLVKELSERTFVSERNNGYDTNSHLDLTMDHSSKTTTSEIPPALRKKNTYHSLIGESHNDTYTRAVELESWVRRLTREADCKQYNEEAIQGWRNNFLRKCADIVEVRFLNAIRVTCVKPFYETFTSCWRAPENGANLEESTLPIHQEFKGMATENTEIRDDFSEHETLTLIRNFFQISRTYSLKHPYLIASIQTGLETRKDLFDFNRFRVDHQILAKLCVNLPKRSALSCIIQLRLVLAPRALTFDRFISETIVAHLFAGFGPDWMTISKLTGFNQFFLKTTIALLHNIDVSAVSPQLWFQIHQKMLDDEKFAPEAPRRRHSPTASFRFKRAFPSSCYNLSEVDCVGNLVSLDGKTTSFQSMPSPWKTMINAADIAASSMD